MRIKKIFGIIIIIMIGLGVLIFNRSKSNDRENNDSGSRLLHDSKNPQITLAEKYQNFYNKPKGGPEQQQWFFEKWHQPYEAMLPTQKLHEIWKEVDSIPSEESQMEKVTATSKIIKPWKCIGPYGINRPNVQHLSRFSGRVKDIEVGENLLRVAAASGGLWDYFYIFPSPITETITSQTIGTFATDPRNRSHIIVGTGEYGISSGTGLWQTFDNGKTWEQNTNIIPVPNSFFRIRFVPIYGSVVHAVTDVGYFKSDDNGKNWTGLLSGIISDIAIHSNNPDIMFIGKWGDGIYKSTNGGDSWTKLTNNGLPTQNVGRIAISLCYLFPNIVYATIAGLDNKTLGVYKSTNQGANWTNITPLSPSNPIDFHGPQGWYNNMIGVHPFDPNFVFTGGISLYRTLDGGSTWKIIFHDNVHNDHHAIAWNKDGSIVWIGNDGGIVYSDDKGENWSLVYNVLPITQFYRIDVCIANGNVMIGGSQDNGTCITKNGESWNTTSGYNGGDTYDVLCDPGNPSRMWMYTGYYGGDWHFIPYRTDDYGRNWTEIRNGLPTPSGHESRIRHDHVSPVYLYYNQGRYLYRSRSGDNWKVINEEDPFPTLFSHEFSVAKWEPTGTTIYVCLPLTDSGKRLMVYDKNLWYERSSSAFPNDVWIRKVIPHPVNTNISYAIMNGISENGPKKKIFRTDNRGITWTNITGNFPNVPMSDLVAHPNDPNKLYIGTKFGCFRTNDGGGNWERWNYGMPEANIVTTLVCIDSLSNNGKLYIVAGTYGRGVWKREISWDDPTPLGRKLAQTKEIKSINLNQNYPNPFNPKTVISYHLPAQSFVNLDVYNTNGQKVTTLVSETQKAGSYMVEWNAADFAAGVYFYHLTTETFSQVRKMILVK